MIHCITCPQVSASKQIVSVISYRWEMDDREFSASGNDRRVAIQPGVGTLIFANPILRDEGFYKCFATNRVGTATTDVVYLRPASKFNVLSRLHWVNHWITTNRQLPATLVTKHFTNVIRK